MSFHTRKHLGSGTVTVATLLELKERNPDTQIHGRAVWKRVDGPGSRRWELHRFHEPSGEIVSDWEFSTREEKRGKRPHYPPLREAVNACYFGG